jgi:hypothetical protein
MTGKRLALILAAFIAAAPLVVSGVASAQSVSSPTPTPRAQATNAFSDNYFSNAGPGALIDGTVRIVNNSGLTEYAEIYVVADDQELKECCSCKLTQGGERILSVLNDLTNNPANGVVAPDGNLALISSSANSDTTPVPSGSLQAWSTHDQGNGWLTEDPFTGLALSPKTESTLAAECAAVQLIGSGAGICTCGVGD